MQIECPKCGSSEHHRVIWDRKILFVIIGNTLLWLFVIVTFDYLGGGGEEAEGWSFRRKCHQCGCKFTEPRPRRPNFDECANCDYNLTGNVSGRCSECGWKLPRRYRAHRRRAVKRERKQARKPKID